MLCPDILILTPGSFLNGVPYHLHGLLRLRQLPRARPLWPGGSNSFDRPTNFLQINLQVPDRLGRNAGALLHKSKKDVLRSDGRMIEPLRLLVGKLQHLASAVSELLVHWTSGIQASSELTRR